MFWPPLLLINCKCCGSKILPTIRRLHLNIVKSELKDKYFERLTDSTPLDKPFPKLPNEFQMHVEGTLNGRTIKANEYYTQNGNMASAILIDASKRAQVINDYTQNLVFFIRQYF